MKKSKFFMARILAIVLLFGMLFSGCATNHYSIYISNADTREVQIRNSGTTDWIVAKNLHDFDISGFSERVDIRVVDRDGLVYTKYDIPFARKDFEEISKEYYQGIGTNVLLAVLAIPVLILAIALGGGQ